MKRNYRVIRSPDSPRLWSIKVDGDRPSWAKSDVFGSYQSRAFARERALIHVKADQLAGIKASYSRGES